MVLRISILSRPQFADAGGAPSRRDSDAGLGVTARCPARLARGPASPRPGPDDARASDHARPGPGAASESGGSLRRHGGRGSQRD